MIELGKYCNLIVVRKSDLGYMLSDGVSEVLLHYKETVGELNINEKVKVYIYTDKENRKTATMYEPKLVIEQFAFVEVVNVIPGTGVFVDNNTPKDLLVSRDYLSYDNSKWPVVGDLLFCSLKIKKDYLVAKVANRFEINSLYNQVKYLEGEKVTANVVRIADNGLGLISKDIVYIFVPDTQYRKAYRLGEEVIVTITKMLEKEAYGTLNDHKEILMDEDKEIILNYLKTHGGIVRLTAKSSSEEVLRIFKMSRKAFKRAYGALYKEHLIDFDEEKTFLTEAIEI